MAGLTDEYIHMETDTRAGSRQTLVDYVGKRGCPDGILCRDDETALGAYRAICDLGLRVGRDVLLVGCDGIQDTQYLECPLSTIVMPVPRMCELAWQFLRQTDGRSVDSPATGGIGAGVGVARVVATRDRAEEAAEEADFLTGG